jgi:hypothetical protein
MGERALCVVLCCQGGRTHTPNNARTVVGSSQHAAVAVVGAVALEVGARGERVGFLGGFRRGGRHGGEVDLAHACWFVGDGWMDGWMDR